MKDRIAFWGTAGENNTESLVIVQLRLADDLIDIWTVPKSEIKEEFEKIAIENPDQFNLEQLPENHTHIERTVMEEYLLPDDIKTHNTALVTRTETEWRVRVLSNKLSQKLEKEIEQLVEQVKALTEYDNEVWQLAKTFWDKVNTHFQEKDLTREHTGLLKNKINEAFDFLKELRSTANEEAKQAFETLNARLQQLVAAIKPTQNMGQIFDRLRKLQDEARQLNLTNNLRDQLRTAFNEAFNKLKEERTKANLNYLERRIKDMRFFISKVERGIKDDQNDLAFQQKRIQNTDGKLEAQLREAKIKMINTRLQENETKLKDMQAVLADLTNQLAKEQQRIEAKSEKELGTTASSTEQTDAKRNKKQKNRNNKKGEKQNPDADKAKEELTHTEIVIENLPNPDQDTWVATDENSTISEEQLPENNPAEPSQEPTEELPANTDSPDDAAQNNAAQEAEISAPIQLPPNTHHFYETTHEEDIEQFMHEKSTPPVQPEDYADGEGLYNFGEEEDK